MRLAILDRGHRLGTKALFALIRVVSRQPVVGAVKLALYRPDFYPAGPLTQEAMRGPSAWSVGDRELMAAFVTKANANRCCVAAHSATSGIWYGDEAKVAATLADLETAPIDEPLRATLRMLGKLSREHDVDGVSRQQIADGLAVSLAFNVTARLADAFDFEVASPNAMNAGARYLLRRGYS
ncbi:MAG: alkylhydroperoxidase AhpD family core domain-containing protein [Acidimicrobiales bacterium]